MATSLLKTPLHAEHLAASAKMMAFAGYDMPLRYTGDNVEHMGVRRQVGLFDVSHMGEFLVRGPKAEAYLNHLTTNNVAALAPGKAQYSCIVTPEGGMLDDLIVYRLEEELFMVVVNAANLEKDWAWFNEHNTQGATLENISDQTALLALSGPLSPNVMKRVTDFDYESLPYYACAKATVAGVDNVLIATTGYTGERTFELYVRAEHAVTVWQALLAEGEGSGIQPTGLAARDSLRLEMGYLLYGNDMTQANTTIEAGLGWITKLKKGDFIGRDALLAVKEAGPAQRLIAFETLERGIPRNGMELQHEGEKIGQVTSGVFSPSLRNGIGLAYIKPDFRAPDTEFDLIVRNKPIKSKVRRTPFVADTSLSRWLNR